MHWSQHSQVQDAGSQAQTPVAQQPQQSHAVLHTQGVLAPDTVATANAPVVTNASTEPIKNLNMASTPKEKTVKETLCLSAEAQAKTLQSKKPGVGHALPEAIKSARRNRVPARESAEREGPDRSSTATTRDSGRARQATRPTVAILRSPPTSIPSLGPRAAPEPGWDELANIRSRCPRCDYPRASRPSQSTGCSNIRTCRRRREQCSSSLWRQAIPPAYSSLPSRRGYRLRGHNLRAHNHSVPRRCRASKRPTT